MEPNLAHCPLIVPLAGMMITGCWLQYTPFTFVGSPTHASLPALAVVSPLTGCGLQDAVSAGGPLAAVLGFAILPLIWSVPEAMITAELTTSFPENSGYVAWVTAAFGPYWGFMVRPPYCDQSDCRVVHMQIPSMHMPSHSVAGMVSNGDIHCSRQSCLHRVKAESNGMHGRRAPPGSCKRAACVEPDAP